MKKLKEYIESGILPSIGEKFKTKENILSNTSGFLVNEKYISTRKKDSIGEYAGFFPGTGGDIWGLKHENGDIAAYCFDELEDIL